MDPNVIRSARPQPRNRINFQKTGITKYTKIMGRRVHRIFYVENPKWEKPRESSNSNYHYMQRCTMMKLQGNNLELTVFATGGGNTLRQRPLRLSHSLGCSHFAPSSWKTENEQQQHKTVCPKSYLYTYDFWAIYKYSLKGSWQTYSQICPRIRISLRVHSSSGSVTGVFSIRLRNRGLHHPAP